MMTDRDLLEFAAKAAGIKALRDPHGVLRDCTGSDPARNIFACKEWNPLTDDSDNQRLAFNLRLHIGYVGTPTPHTVWAGNGNVSAEETLTGPESLRRAVVRAAAMLAEHVEQKPASEA
jgi:hypothetical protein